MQDDHWEFGCGCDRRDFLATMGTALGGLSLASISTDGAENAAETVPGHAHALIPARGVASSVPASRWDYGFLTGNGRIGAIVYGPTQETIVLNHERLYLPHPRPEICDLGEALPGGSSDHPGKGHVAALKFSLEKRPNKVISITTATLSPGLRIEARNARQRHRNGLRANHRLSNRRSVGALAR